MLLLLDKVLDLVNVRQHNILMILELVLIVTLYARFVMVELILVINVLRNIT